MGIALPPKASRAARRPDPKSRFTNDGQRGARIEGVRGLASSAGGRAPGCDVELVSGHMVRPDMLVAVVPEPEGLVERAKARTRGLAVQAHVPADERAGALHGPAQEPRGRARSGVPPADREAVDVGRVLEAHLGQKTGSSS